MREDRDADEPRDVPDAVSEWLAGVAAEQGVSPAELLARLLEAGGPGPGDGPPNERSDDAGDRFDEIEARIDGLESTMEELIDDVRERVVQVKREADGKAQADHEHPELEARFRRLLEELEDVRSTVDRVDERTTSGFENYETILDYLVETTDDLDRHLTVLASAVLDVHERTDALAESRGRSVAALARTANEHGVTRADCGSCGEPVEIGLLREPRCPHCEATFAGVEPARGIFSRSVLDADPPPALESGDPAEDESEPWLEALEQLRRRSRSAPGSDGERSGSAPTRSSVASRTDALGDETAAPPDADVDDGRIREEPGSHGVPDPHPEPEPEPEPETDSDPEPDPGPESTDAGSESGPGTRPPDGEVASDGGDDR